MINYQFNADREAAGKAIDVTSSGAIDRVPESIQPGILLPTNTQLYNPAAWLKTGYGPSEILLSTAILVHAIGILLAAFKLSKQR
jgi:hypothetical protein